MADVAPRSIIAASLGGWVDMNPPAREMHEDLAWWHVGCEGTHSSVVVADPGTLGDRPGVRELTEHLLPAPVRTVERLGWRMVGGFVVVDLPVDPELGLVVPEEDEEPLARHR
ncbi:hypothetical protein ACFV9E_03425 [Streptomyces sp. NPDC059835]|uniref:hypothetical protein n=1 Tax=Streptomyces sp. NPDC059835 TaxID=3346967 RepID=UPI00365C7A73